MKPTLTMALLCALGCAPCQTFAAEKPETFAEMKLRAETTPPDECVRICAGVARRAIEEAKTEFSAGTDSAAKALLGEVKTYADKAADAATHTRKHEKQLEIDLRDLSHRLEALKRELTPENQPAVEEAMTHLEKLRTRLLDSMFGKGKK